MKKRIVVIGAGPKALAINAKAFVLDNLDDSIEIVAIDKNGIASNWNGMNGFTSGKHSLGTPPEKDVCFPYMSEFIDSKPNINQDSFKFSWFSFLIETQEYQDWTDRGKPSPSHNKWADYLSWVGKKTNLELIVANVFKVAVVNEKWEINYIEDNEYDNPKTISADALVITGPGKPRPLPPDTQHQHYKNGQSYWKDRTFLETILDKAKRKNARIGVIGGGETSASIVYDLIDFFSNKNVDNTISVDVINRRATIFSRGEGFHENKFYTNPEGWNKLTNPLRREFIARTDRGVFSLNTIEKINGCKFINPIFGEVRGVSARHENSLRIKIARNENGKEVIEGWDYDCVINALGFDNLGFFDYMDQSFFDAIEIEKMKILEDKNIIEDNIDQFLSLKLLEKPRLFLPMNSAFKQGPGFPNLSSLGFVSDRILRYFKNSKK